MVEGLYGRSFLKLLDFTPDQVRGLIELSARFKALKCAGVPHRYLEGRNLVLLFEKTSTRTRCSFEVAGRDLGMGVTYLDPGSSQMGAKESIADTAKVLGRLFDGIEYRGFGQAIVEELAENAGVPVFNGLTDEFHPTQMIADMLTIRENFPGGLQGLRLVFMGDAANNVANSLMVVCAMLGMHFVGCSPAALRPDPALIERCEDLAAFSGGSVAFTDDALAAVEGADVVYTDIWLSMGQPSELWAERIEQLTPYRVTGELLERASERAIFLHCLPSFHDTKTTTGAKIAEEFGITEMEVTDEVFLGPRSMVFDEAENRMHSIKAILFAFMHDGPLPTELAEAGDFAV